MGHWESPSKGFWLPLVPRFFQVPVVREPDDLFLIEFTRPMVLSRDFSQFLEKFSKDQLPEGPRLRRLMGQFYFSVSGYMEDDREIYDIPEVRAFYQEFFKVWPYWFFFCSLSRDEFAMMALCCMKPGKRHFSAGRQVGVEFDEIELRAFLRVGFPGLNLMALRAGMDEPEVERRSEALYAYLVEGRREEPQI